MTSKAKGFVSGIVSGILIRTDVILAWGHISVDWLPGNSQKNRKKNKYIEDCATRNTFESIQIAVYRTDNSRELGNLLMFLFLSRKAPPNVILHEFIVQPCCIHVSSGGVSFQVTEPSLGFQDGENSVNSSEGLCLPLSTRYTKVIKFNWKLFCTSHCT